MDRHNAAAAAAADDEYDHEGLYMMTAREMLARAQMSYVQPQNNPLHVQTLAEIKLMMCDFIDNSRELAQGVMYTDVYNLRGRPDRDLRTRRFARVDDYLEEVLDNIGLLHEEFERLFTKYRQEVEEESEPITVIVENGVSGEAYVFENLFPLEETIASLKQRVHQTRILHQGPDFERLSERQRRYVVDDTPRDAMVLNYRYIRNIQLTTPELERIQAEERRVAEEQARERHRREFERRYPDREYYPGIPMRAPARPQLAWAPPPPPEEDRVHNLSRMGFDNRMTLCEAGIKDEDVLTVIIN